jgi:hypothetical protein
MERSKITWEQVKELLPARVSLYHVDYNDSLDDHADLLQECIQGTPDKLYEKIDEWYQDSPFYAFEYYDKDIKSDIKRAFDVGSDEAEEIFEEYREEIRDELYNRDDSDVYKDLLRNTKSFAMFYDTGYEVSDGSWSWGERTMKQVVKEIKKTLGIKIKDNTWDKEIDMMVRQASYGGQLVVYFYDSVDDFIGVEEDKNMIRLYNAHVAIIDTSGGSGDNCYLGGVEIVLPFDKSNLYICKAVKYSYTHDVCGMYDNWCSGVTVELFTKKTKKVAAKSSLAAQQQREKEYEETYRKGGCTFGDMNITRHRDTPYSIDYPAGNRCTQCHTFWID